MTLDELKRNLEEIREKTSRAAMRAGRKGEEVSLMAVTKTHDFETVMTAYLAGIRIFGENRVKEAEGKYLDKPDDMELHLIGHLQTNKIKAAQDLFSWFDSIDSLHTAEALNRRLAETGKKARFLVEINTSGEDSKSGYASYEDFLEEAESLFRLENLEPRGLMTGGPLTGDAREVRKSFRVLKACFDDMRDRFPFLSADVLSMGMSSDYEIAVEEGSTLIRIGTAIFGRRPA